MKFRTSGHDKKEHITTTFAVFVVEQLRCTDSGGYDRKKTDVFEPV